MSANATDYKTLGLRVQPDPDRIGPRGNVRGWQVVDIETGIIAFSDAFHRFQDRCHIFCQGVAYARGEEI